jgi:rhombotail lipoprotein
MVSGLRRVALIALAGLLGAGCAVQKQMRSNALEYLYPGDAEPVPTTDVVLKLPARVGIAFAPPAGVVGSGMAIQDTFSAERKQQLLQRVSDAFAGRKNIADIEVIPAQFLSPKGSFPELQRLRSSFGVDYIVLVSYDQLQFSESQKSSLLYWVTYGAGAFIIKGEKNETRTLMDAMVYDIDSRTMLFHAVGQSSVKASSTLVDLSKEMRQRSEEGFLAATDDLIANLGAALAEFQRQSATGTVRGTGTPALKVADQRGVVAPADSGGGGAIDGMMLVLLGVGGLWRGRRHG